AEQVAAEPLRGIGRAWIVGREADAPHPVHRAGFDEYAVAGAEKVRAQVGVLAELGHRAGENDVEAVPQPHLLVEPAHLAAERLRPAGSRGREYLRDDRLIAEPPRLARHHVVLGAGVPDAVDGERRRPPLAQAARADAAVGLRAVAPEEEVLHPTAGRGQRPQLVDVAR